MSYKVVKSVKIEPKIWNDARDKAKEQGYTMAGLIKNLLLDYVLERGDRHEGIRLSKEGPGR
jgi:hypothetical protein